MTTTKQNELYDQTLYNQLVSYIEQNQERFYKLAYSYAKNRETALDIVQNAIYKALVSIHSLKHPDYIKTWFYRILVNASIDELRKSSKVVPINPSDIKEEPLYAQSHTLFHDDQQSDHAQRLDLYAALDKLDPKTRTIINLRFFEDMKFDDIAAILGENTSNVKTKLYRTLDSLKSELNVSWEGSI